jgi:hypothetical protein
LTEIFIAIQIPRSGDQSLHIERIVSDAIEFHSALLALSRHFPIQFEGLVLVVME